MTEELEAPPATEEEDAGVGLRELRPKDVGLYAAFEISPEPMYGPAELGEDMVQAIASMVNGAMGAESAPRLFEVGQAWEARMFDRGYQWLLSNGAGGWKIFGSDSGKSTNPTEVADSAKKWAVNMYGARKDKIVAALTVKDPEPEFFPKLAGNALCEDVAEESDKYKHLWKQVTNVRNLCVKIAGLFYTDDRVALITESIQDAQRFGMDGDKPGIAELTRGYGKLEIRVPMSIDEDDPLPWMSRGRELDLAVAKEKFSWIAAKVKSGSRDAGKSDRTARITVRNAINSNLSLTSGAVERVVTEETIWLRPSQYRDIVDDSLRAKFRENFPSGLRVVYAGSEFAYCRNEKMDDCVCILYSRDGTGQNRRAIGSNNITTQKMLNFDFSLAHRYLQNVPRRVHDSEKINSESQAQQRNDPQQSFPVTREQGEDVKNFFGTEILPGMPPELMSAIEMLVDGLPETLDGAAPSMFGDPTNTDTVGGITIQRDQALQVFGTPYNATTWGIALSCQKAAKWAGRNRSGQFSSMIPGQGRISVDFDKLGGEGETYCFPEADSGFPESEAEKEQRLMDAVDSSAHLPALAQALNDPTNYQAVDKVTKRFGIRIPGADSVRKQQQEFEKLLESAPMDNPAFIEAQQQIDKAQVEGATDPEAQTPEGQQAMQAAQQALGKIPPLVSSVPVEQDASVNHSIEAAICFAMINSPEGQKLKGSATDGTPGPFKNLMLHWQGHVDMAKKLSPPPAEDGKANTNLAVDKLPPNALAAVLKAKYSVDVSPEDVTPVPEDTDVHEIVEEKEGVDAAGVPVKRKISYSGKPLQ